MRWLGWTCLFLLAGLLPLAAEDWTTANGHTYHNVTVLGQEDDGVSITYDGGAGKIPYYELPVDIQKRFGQDVDSLTAKRRAVDKAVDDAITAAAAAQIPVPQNQPGGAPGTGPQYAAPGPNPSGAPGTAQQNTAPVNPGATPNSAQNTAPGGTPGAAPGNVQNPSPGNPAVANGPGATPTSGVPKAPGQSPAPGAPHNATPNTAANNGAYPGKPGAGIPTGPAENLPSLEEPVSRTPSPTGLYASGGKPLQLTVANYSYNASLDICYLDSPTIDVSIDPPPKTPLPPGQGCSLAFRIVTEGRTPQLPERFEATFLAVGGDGGDLADRAIVFTTSSGQIGVADEDRKDSGTLPGGAQSYATFYLDASQVRQICDGKSFTFSVGPYLYRVNDLGAQTLHSYMTDVDSLQPATPSIIRTFDRWLSRIPSFFSIISTICEYVILGSFALLVAASIAAFILGISRFIKM
jgi:hypothetical protein